MKILKNILLGLLALIALLTALVFACAGNPELSKQISNAIYGSDRTEDDGSTADTAGGDAADGENTDLSEDTLNGASALQTSDLDSQIDESDAYLPDADSLQSLSDTGDAGAAGNGEIAEESAAGSDPSIYIAPDENSLVIPEKVAGLTGYEEPKQTSSDIDDLQADEIESELGVKNTGDDLDFDPLYYPYYNMLSDKEKHLYRQVYANADALEESFAPVEACTPADMERVMEAVYCDHPELFWVNTAYNLKCRRNRQVAEIDLSFNSLADNLAAEKEKFESTADSIASETSEMEDDLRKEEYVHDRLLDMIDYDLSAPMSQSAYSALVNGRTVCAGYARAFQYIMQKLGIPCYYCTGYAGENHAWNIIKLGDDYYNVDPTWDDAEPVSYDYFNKSDADYADTHARKSLSKNLPACSGTGYQAQGIPQSFDGTDENADTQEGSGAVVYVIIK